MDQDLIIEIDDSTGMALSPGAIEPIELNAEPSFHAAPKGLVEEKGIALILKMVEDPETETGDISRLIALEIAHVIASMSQEDPLRRNNRSMRDLNDQVKALRELQKTLTESESLSKRDSLNLDGPKFQFLFRAIMDLYRQALKDAGIEDALAKNVMLQFGDLIKSNDEIIRRDLNKLDTGR